MRLGYTLLLAGVTATSVTAYNDKTRRSFEPTMSYPFSLESKMLGGSCLQVDPAFNRFAYMERCKHSEDQEFKLVAPVEVDQIDGSVGFNIATGDGSLCLSLPASPGSPMRAVACSLPSTNSKTVFYLEAIPHVQDSYRIINRQSGFCLDGSINSALYAWYCDPMGKSQSFYIPSFVVSILDPYSEPPHPVPTEVGPMPTEPPFPSTEEPKESETNHIQDHYITCYFDENNEHPGYFGPNHYRDNEITNDNNFFCSLVSADHNVYYCRNFYNRSADDNDYYPDNHNYHHSSDFDYTNNHNHSKHCSHHDHYSYHHHHNYHHPAHNNYHHYSTHNNNDYYSAHNNYDDYPDHNDYDYYPAHNNYDYYPDHNHHLIYSTSTNPAFYFPRRSNSNYLPLPQPMLDSSSIVHLPCSLQRGRQNSVMVQSRRILGPRDVNQLCNTSYGVSGLVVGCNSMRPCTGAAEEYFTFSNPDVMVPSARARGEGTTCSRITYRREWRDLTQAERRTYARAVNGIRSLPSSSGRGSAFDDLVAIHRAAGSFIHSTALFLPWHRAFLEMYENLLRRVEPSVSLVYWDWSSDSRVPFRDSPDITMVFNPDPLEGLGTKGNSNQDTCVRDGFVSGWTSGALSGSRCLRRNYDAGFDVPSTSEISILVTRANTFSSMADQLESYHNHLHGAIGGSGGDMTFVNLSPNDPFFYMHHVNVDRIWSLWQTSNPSLELTFSGIGIFPLRGTTTIQSNDLMPSFNIPNSAILPLGRNGHCSVYLQRGERIPSSIRNSRRQSQLSRRAGISFPWLSPNLATFLSSNLKKIRVGSGKYGTIKLDPLSPTPLFFFEGNYRDMVEMGMNGTAGNMGSLEEYIAKFRRLEGNMREMQEELERRIDEYFEEHPEIKDPANDEAAYSRAYQYALDSLLRVRLD
ncbi:hypothetical protein HDU67_002729 [Dinochytrium kinnereticum]|nr:hypothetical protein HDU67_002729 [Dinochytrium kinnereticum]